MRLVRSLRRANRAMSRLSTPALLDEFRQTRTHLLCKPGTPFFSQQCPIEPIVLGDMLEEPNPYLCGMILSQFADGFKQLAQGLLKDLFDQIVFVLIVAIE